MPTFSSLLTCYSRRRSTAPVDKPSGAGLVHVPILGVGGHGTGAFDRIDSIEVGQVRRSDLVRETGTRCVHSPSQSGPWYRSTYVRRQGWTLQTSSNIVRGGWRIPGPSLRDRRHDLVLTIDVGQSLLRLRHCMETIVSSKLLEAEADHLHWSIYDKGHVI